MSTNDSSREPAEILLRLTLEDGLISGVSASRTEEGADPLPELAGKEPEEVLSRWPLGSEFVMLMLKTDSASYHAAGRMDSETSVIVYYIDTDDYGLANPAVPTIRLFPERHLPIVSPGFVCLMGYTPWELSQSELISSLPGDTENTGGQVTLFCKSGKARRLVFSRTSSGNGQVD